MLPFSFDVVLDFVANSTVLTSNTIISLVFAGSSLYRIPALERFIQTVELCKPVKACCRFSIRSILSNSAVNTDVIIPKHKDLTKQSIIMVQQKTFAILASCMNFEKLQHIHEDLMKVIKYSMLKQKKESTLYGTLSIMNLSYFIFWLLFKFQLN